MVIRKLNIFQRFDIWLEKNGVDDYDNRIHLAAGLMVFSVVFTLVLLGIGTYAVYSTLTTLACGIA